MACGCEQTTTTPCVSLCPDATGCPIQLDFDCVIYHKDNNEISNLDGLGLTNGATLTLFAETVDNLIGQTKVADYVLPCLRATYTINTLKQFAEAVDTQICQIKSDVTSLAALVNLPITPQDTNTVDITTSGTNSHTIKADVKISVTGTNLLQGLSDGLHVAPQSLSVNNATKMLSISNGNSVDLSGLGCSASPFLGNVTTDPTTTEDGDYWFNTTSGQLKIKVNGLVKVVTIS